MLMFGRKAEKKGESGPAAYESTTVGFEFEYANLRILDGGEPKSVLFKSTARSVSHEALLQVTVDMGGDAGNTTELILGPVLADPVGGQTAWRTLHCHLAWFYQAVEALRARARFIDKVELAELYRNLEQPGKCTCVAIPSSVLESVRTTSAELARDKREDAFGGASTELEVRCSGATTTPQPGGAKQQLEREEQKHAQKHDQKQEKARPRFEASENWGHAGPQMSVALVIDDLARPMSRTARFFGHNCGSVRQYMHVLANVHAYLDLVGVDEPARVSAAGVLTFIAFMVDQVMQANDIYEIDNKSVTYKNAWGLLPKVHPREIWALSPGLDKTLDVRDHKGEKFAKALFAESAAASRAFTQLLADQLGRQVWKPSPKQISVIHIHGRAAAVFELRSCPQDLDPCDLEQWATRCHRGRDHGKTSQPTEDPFEMFADPTRATKYLVKVARLWQLDDDQGDWPDLDAGTKITVTGVRDEAYKEGLRRQRQQSPTSSDDDEPDTWEDD